MADYHFAQATTWSEVQAVHDRWVADFNFQAHWAHRQRRVPSGCGRDSPAEVLGCVHGRVSTPADLHRTFYKRVLDAGWTATGLCGFAIGACTGNVACRGRLLWCGCTVKP
jgi:hypothetical protein